MLTKLNTPTIFADPATVASVSHCRHSFDAKRRLGYVLALAGSSVR